MADLRPWRLSSVGTVMFAAFALFICGIAVVMLSLVPRMHVAPIARLFVVTLCLSEIGYIVCFLMWRRYWRHVGWDIGFVSFIRGPEPDYEEAKGAWRWGRRMVVCWMILLISLLGVPVVQTLVDRTW